MSAVFQYQSGLFLIKWNFFLLSVDNTILVIHQTLYRSSVQDRLVEDLLAVFFLYFYVDIIIWLDPHKRPHLAETMTAAFLHADMTGFFYNCILRLRDKFYLHALRLLRHLAEPVVYFLRATRQTSGSCTDKDPVRIRMQHLFCLFYCCVKLRYICYSIHPHPPSILLSMQLPSPVS